MKKLMLAALLALPLSLAAGQTASAQCCIGLKGGFNVKVCATGGGFLCPYFDKCGGKSGGGSGCCNHGCGTGYAPYSACGDNVPGPWYTYWPQAPGGTQVGLAFPGWSLENNFNIPAPASNSYASYFGSPAGGSTFGAGYAYGGGGASYQPSYAYQPVYPTGPAGYAGMNYGAGYAPAPVQPVGYYPGYWYGR